MAIILFPFAYPALSTRQEAIHLADSLRKQALVLTIGNALTRGMGFLLHLILARTMGAEALGVMEMANTVGMLALTPVTAGLPSAVSRLSAKHPPADRDEVLRAALHLVRRLSFMLMPALVLLAPFLAWLQGDSRTLPAILLCVPDILLLGLGGVYCGHCYALSNTRLPALTECCEQLVRLAMCLALLTLLPRRSIALTAALPGAAEAVAALAVVLLFRRKLGPAPSLARPSAALQKELWRLAAPTVLSRLCTTGMRMFSTMLLPVCLLRSGLTHHAATAQLGLLNGMVLPLLMLPGVATGALCMVATPAVSRLEDCPARLRRTTVQLSLSALGIGLCAALGLYVLADFISVFLYAQPALAPLVRCLCPLSVLFALHQVQCGLVAGRGLQRKALYGSILSSVVNLLATAVLAAHPAWRLFGAGAALMLGQLTAIGWNTVLLFSRKGLRTACAQA